MNDSIPSQKQLNFYNQTSSQQESSQGTRKFEDDEEYYDDENNEDEDKELEIIVNNLKSEFNDLKNVMMRKNNRSPLKQQQLNQ